MGTDEFDVALEVGMKVAEALPASIQTRVCQECGGIDTDALLDDGSLEACTYCGTALVSGPEACRLCGAGCGICRPERLLRGRVRRGPAAPLLARAALAFSMEESRRSAAGRSSSAAHVPVQTSMTSLPGSDPLLNQPTYHIVDEAGGIRRLLECDVPTEICNEARLKDLS